MSDILNWVTLLGVIALGVFVSRWVILRNLPIPQGRFLWMKFWLLWPFVAGIASVAAFVVMFGALYLIWGGVDLLLLEGVTDSNAFFSFKVMIISLPYWYALIFAIWLQFDSNRSHLLEVARLKTQKIKSGEIS